jgi:hypothetical protein
MAYRTVHERFWRDPKVIKLSLKEKLLFLYFITSSDAHYSGLYYCPIQIIQIQTGMSEKDVMQSIDTLSIQHMIEYDMGTNEVFVVNMAKFQVVSDTQIKGVANHFKDSIQSQVLKQNFMKKYDTLSIPYQIGISYPIDTTETDTDTERDTERETKPETKTAEKDIDTFSVFKDAWASYPVGCKRTAETEFAWLKEKHKSDWKAVLLLLKPAMENYNSYIQKKKQVDSTTKVKHMQGWLTDRMWEMYKPQEKKEPKQQFIELNPFEVSNEQ